VAKGKRGTVFTVTLRGALFVERDNHVVVVVDATPP